MPEADISDAYTFPVKGARRASTSRTIVALVLREMSTTYGRSSLGYIWAILEPVAGIILLTFIFSFAFRAPPVGTNFPLFFASGILPFMAYMDISGKITSALRFSRPLLAYPGVTFMDALIARLVLNAITHLMIMALVLTAILIAYNVDVILDPPALLIGFCMILALSLGIGLINCFLITAFPIWERIWAILNRPLFFISGILFTYETLPHPYQGYMWWNPLIHIIGQMRSGIYATYNASYVSYLYVFLVSLVLMTVGLLLLRRYHRDMQNN